MQDIVRTRLLLFLTGIIIVPLGTVLVILFAKGYRPDLEKREIKVTGLLVAHSYPEGAQVYVNSELKSATNTTLNLKPGDYSVTISKDGYHSWKKDMKIEPEIVTRATAVLFPSVSTFKQISTKGAANPSLSPDGTKVAFTSISGQQLYLLDLSESALGLLNRESKQLADFKNINLRVDKLVWSPDSRQILALNSIASGSAYLVDIYSQKTTNATINLSAIIAEWNQSHLTQESQKISSIDYSLREFLATAAASIAWSPRENKLLYTATASAALPSEIKKPLPGSSTQPQNRSISPGGVYVYDLEEDRNFLIDTLSTPTPTPKVRSKQPTRSQISNLQSNNGWLWFPTSSHLYRVENNKIIIVEYDSKNPVVVYAGPLKDQNAIPYPSAKQMLILTNLDIITPTSSASAIPNLYALILR